MIKTGSPRNRPERILSACSPELRSRVRDWIERDISYVTHPEFHNPGFETDWADRRPTSLDHEPDSTTTGPGLAFVNGLVDAPVLTPAEETFLFTWMNYLRYRAEQSRQKLDLNCPQPRLLEQLESDMAQSQQLRNRIVRSNLRLVVALARTFSDSLDTMSELIAEATIPLIRAVELFDISLGNRFSTYATWAVRNHMGRCLKRRQTGDRGTLLEPEFLDVIEDRTTSPDEQLRLQADHAEIVRTLLQELNERERLVVSARFGLDGHPRGQSLQEIADRVGLSKERVRQIAMHAISKLQEIARDSGIQP